jgi:type IV pilus assembly protein PilE
MKNTRGFTLIELMIAVAIVGVLVAIAYPSYQNSLIKGTRGAAKAFLLEVAQKEQQYLLDNRTYFAAATANDFKDRGVPIPREVSQYYTVAALAPAGNPPTFSVTATPLPSGRMKDDGTLTIDQAGTKTSSKANKW